MGLHKGQTNNPAGRPKGSKNKRTEEWEALGESIMGEHTKTFNEILRKKAETDEDKFAELYLKLMEYFKPKLARSETKNAHELIDFRIEDVLKRRD